MRSLIDIFLFALNISPTDKEYLEIKEKLNNISTSELSFLMYNQRVGNLSEILDMDTDKNNDLWSNLRSCGSGINKSHFKKIKIEGKHKSNNYYKSRKMLGKHKKYDKKFLYKFEYFWIRDLALRKLEWNLLKIGRIYNREEIISKISDDTLDVILSDDCNLIDILRVCCDELIHSIGKSLVYRLKYVGYGRNIYTEYRKWLELDTKYCSVLMAQSFKEDGSFSDKLTERFENRIKSKKSLTKKLS